MNESRSLLGGAMGEMAEVQRGNAGHKIKVGHGIRWVLHDEEVGAKFAILRQIRAL